MWGVGLSHEIHTIAEAETVLNVESSMQAIVSARWFHSAGGEAAKGKSREASLGR
jgi:hypothetical protein